MPVQAAQSNNSRASDNKFAKFFGYNYDNWEQRSLMRLNFIAVLLVTISWIFFIIAVVLFCTSSSLRQAYLADPSSLNNGSYDAQNGIAIFCIICFFCIWVALFIMGIYIVGKARDLPNLSKNWWWAIFDIILPWIFMYVSYFVWKATLDKVISLSNASFKTDVDFKFEHDEQRDAEVEFYREKKKEIAQEEVAQGGGKSLNIDGKSANSHKKHRK